MHLGEKTQHLFYCKSAAEKNFSTLPSSSLMSNTVPVILTRLFSNSGPGGGLDRVVQPFKVRGYHQGLIAWARCTSSVYPHIRSRQESPWSGKLLEVCTGLDSGPGLFQAPLVLTCRCSRAWLAAWASNSISCMRVFSRAYGARWEKHRAQGAGVAV